jgi:universal stress protein A
LTGIIYSKPAMPHGDDVLAALFSGRGTHVFEYQRILLAVDLAGDSTEIAQRARTIAAALGADLRIVHVVEPVPVVVPIPPAPVVPVLIRTQEELLEAARQRLADLAAQLGVPETGWSVELGNIKAEILRVARERQVNLIVLGARERHGLSLLVPLTEDTVLHAAPCDVLAVRIHE